MNASELHTYRQTKTEIRDKIDGETYKIIGATELEEVPFVVLKNTKILKAIPLSMIQQDSPQDIAHTSIPTVGLPSFTENQWLEKNEQLKNLLTEYAVSTYPKVTKALRNRTESRHQGYEGSVQEFQRPKAGPDHSEGLDYDKARGTIEKWK